MFLRLQVLKKSGSDALTALTKQTYAGTPMLTGTSAATAANLGDHMELRLANTGSHTALSSFS